MRIESQVCSLEQAKKLVELGITGKSWLQWMAPDEYNVAAYVLVAGNGSAGTRYPAFTVAELGRMLPDGSDLLGVPTKVAQFDSFRHVAHAAPGWSCGAELSRNKGVWRVQRAETEAQARAAMLIYLLENNHITPEQVNQRLAQP